MRKLRYPSLQDWYAYGYEVCKEKYEAQARKKAEKEKLEMPKESCTALGMTYSIIFWLRDNCLSDAGTWT